jgi:hypothetical protein
MKIKVRGLGWVYQPVYKNKRTGERRTSAVWWIQYYWRGRRFREGAGSTSRSEAVKLLRRRFAEMGRGRLIGRDIERTTFVELKAILLDEYRVNERKSIETARGSMKALEGYFGGDYARDISLDRLMAYVNTRLEAGRRPATIRNELAALKRAFHLAERAGKAVCPPFPVLRIQNTRTGFFEEPEFRALMAELPDVVLQGLSPRRCSAGFPHPLRAR